MASKCYKLSNKLILFNKYLNNFCRAIAVFARSSLRCKSTNLLTLIGTRPSKRGRLLLFLDVLRVLAVQKCDRPPDESECDRTPTTSSPRLPSLSQRCLLVMFSPRLLTARAFGRSVSVGDRPPT